MMACVWSAHPLLRRRLSKSVDWNPWHVICGTECNNEWCHVDSLGRVASMTYKRYAKFKDVVKHAARSLSVVLCELHRLCGADGKCTEDNG
jgi:hypothetical protein